MNVPLDVLIRKFRNEEARRAYETINDASAHFLSYIEKFSRDGVDEKSHLFPLLFQRFKRIETNVLKHMRIDLSQLGESLQKITVAIRNKQPADLGEDFKFDPRARFLELLHEDIHKEKVRELEGVLADKSLVDFVKKYGDVIDEALGRAINVPISIDDELKGEIS